MIAVELLEQNLNWVNLLMAWKAKFKFQYKFSYFIRETAFPFLVDDQAHCSAVTLQKTTTIYTGIQYTNIKLS